MDQIAGLRDALVRLGVHGNAFKAAVDKFSPLEYLSELDAPTRIAIAISLAVCAYIIFASVVRAGRMVVSLVCFLLQLAIVFVVVLVLLGHQETLSSIVRYKFPWS